MKNIFKFFGIAAIASMMLVACGEKVTYTITTNVNNPEMGTVTGGGVYEEGDVCTLTAVPNEGYTFANWTDGNTDNPRTITVTEDASYTANFVAVITDHATVNFGETTWEATFVGAGTYEGNLIVRLYQDQTANDKPSVYMVSGKTVGTHTYVQGNGLNIFYFNYNDDYTAYQGTNYPTWQTETHTQVITAIDMNAQTFTYTSNSTVFNLADYLQEIDNTKALTTDVSGEWQTINFSKGGMPIAFVK